MAVLALIVALLVPVPGSTTCPDVHVIGVRGSGQPAGFGSQVAPVVESIVETVDASGRATTSEALEYPAISVSDSLGLVLLTGEYASSVLAGVDALDDRLADIASGCPSTEIVLVGYSQGAQVIKQALADSLPVHRLAGIVLLADPTRDPSQSGIARLGDPGVAAEGAFGAVPLPDHARVVTIDVCAAGDGVCERGRRSLTAHTFGYADTPAVVAPMVVASLDGRIAAIPRLR